MEERGGPNCHSLFTYAEIGRGEATELFDDHLCVLDLCHELFVRQRSRRVMGPSVDRDLMTGTTGSTSRLPVLEHIRADIKQGRLLVRRVQEIVQLRTKRSWAIIVGQTPDTQGASDQILVDAVRLGPVARVGGDAGRVRGITTSREGDHRENGDGGHVDGGQPTLDEVGVSRGDGILGRVGTSKSAVKGRKGDDCWGNGCS